jgi:hypothetical protein
LGVPAPLAAAAALLEFCGGRQTLPVRHRHLQSACDDLALLLLLLLGLREPFCLLHLVVGVHVGEGVAVQRTAAAAAAAVELHAEQMIQQ